MDNLQIKFTHSNTVRDKKPYTIYEIELRSSNTIQWVIYKRFSHFDALHIALTKSNLSNTIKQRLPLLPPKRLTRSLASEFVEKRKVELEEYMIKLLDVSDILHHPIVLAFIECPDSVRSVLTQNLGNTAILSSDTMTSSMRELELTDRFGHNYTQLSADERRVYELCYELKYNTNKVNTIKQYEEYFFTNRPRLSNESIRHLLTGTDGSTPFYTAPTPQLAQSRSHSTLTQSSPSESNSNGNSSAGGIPERATSAQERSTPGLIHICGDISYSHVASRAALYLLTRLLDVEKNKDAALFLDIFCTLDVRVLKLLNLSEHILNERGNRTGAFKLINILQTNQQQHTGVDSGLVDNVVSSATAMQEYTKWQEHISSQSQSLQHTSSHPIDTTLKSLSLDTGYKQIAQQCFQSLLSVYHDRQGWRHVTPVSSLPKMTDINDQVSVSYKKDSVKDMVLVRCTAIVPYPVDAVVKLIGNVRRRKEWDCKFHRGALIQALDAQHDVLHLVFKSFSSPYKYRDFCVLQSYTTTQEGGYVQACRSVIHPLAPEGKEHVRAVLYPTGYIVTPLQNQTVNIHTQANAAAQTNTATSSPTQPTTSSSSPSSNSGTPYMVGQSPSPSVPSLYLPSPQQSAMHSIASAQLPPPIGTSTDACLLSFIAQMDKESILIVSPDLLGETNELRHNMNNVKSCLAADYGIRTLQPSTHTQHLMSPANITPTTKPSPSSGFVSINQQDKSIQQLALNPPQRHGGFLPVNFSLQNSPNNIKPININH